MIIEFPIERRQRAMRKPVQRIGAGVTIVCNKSVLVTSEPKSEDAAFLNNVRALHWRHNNPDGAA